MSAAYRQYRTCLMDYHNRHERFPALFEVSADLDLEDFWTLFRDVYEGTNGITVHAEVIRRMLTAERINSTARLSAFSIEDREFMKRAIRRGTPIKVYRGGAQQNLTGFAWTTKKDVALHHAVHCGRPEGHLISGRLQPSKMILPISDTGEIVAFPEDVTVEKVVDIKGLSGEALMECRMKGMVASHGANYVMEMTPAEYFVHAVTNDQIDRDVVLNHLRAGRQFIEPFGFKTRVETIDSIIEALEGVDVRRAG